MRDGDHYVVNGTKTWISNGIHGQCFAVLVKTDPDAEPRHKGMTHVPGREGAGLHASSRKLEKLGYKGIDSAELVFEDYRVPAVNLIGGARAAACRRRSAGSSSAASTSRRAACGIAKAALDEAVRYAQLRKTFGKPIGEHQAIQLKLAEMATAPRPRALLTYKRPRGLRRGPALRHGGRHGEVLRLRGGARERASRRCASTAPTATPRSSTSSATTATRRCSCIGEGTNEMQRIIIARQLVERNPI